MTTETQIKTEEDAESIMTDPVMLLLSVRVNIDGAGLMPLLKAVDHLKDTNIDPTDSEGCSTMTEMDMLQSGQDAKSSFEDRDNPLLNVLRLRWNCFCAFVDI